MQIVGRGIFVLVSLFFLGTGLVMIVNPASVLEAMLIPATNDPAALSSVRGLWGGAIFAIGVSVLIGAIKQDFASIRVGAIFVLSIIAARTIGYVDDGSFPEFLSMMAPPVMVFVLMLVGHKLMASGNKSNE